MNAVWQVQAAKSRFGDMIKTSRPPVIARHGRAVAQVLATRPGERAASAAPPDAFEAFVACLQSAPRADRRAVPLRRSRKLALALG
ncbi:MAG TPA: hypothetical protein PLB25_13800 [Rhodoferax sp.]|nr:hypothetical protein [Rhodoferax sp.]